MRRAKIGHLKPKPGWLQILVVLVAAASVLLATGQTSYLLHFSEVRHAVCEHGELIHLDSDDEARPSDEAPVDETSPACSRAPQHAATAHHHCPTAARGRHGQASLIAPREGAMGTASVDSSPALSVRIWAKPRGVLRFAPKTSPPVSA